MSRLAFFFDSSTCSGCKACQVACKDKNDLPVGQLWRRVYEVSGGGDSYYSAANFATKVRGVGVWFSNYNGSGLALTPRVYLVPVGEDVLRELVGFNHNAHGLRIVRELEHRYPFPGLNLTTVVLEGGQPLQVQAAGEAAEDAAAPVVGGGEAQQLADARRDGGAAEGDGEEGGGHERQGHRQGGGHEQQRRRPGEERLPQQVGRQQRALPQVPRARLSEQVGGIDGGAQGQRDPR